VKLLFLFIILFRFTAPYTQTIRVRIYDAIQTKELQIVIGSGNYLLVANQPDGSTKQITLRTLAQGRIKMSGSQLQFVQNGSILLQSSQFEFIQQAREDSSIGPFRQSPPKQEPTKVTLNSRCVKGKFV
jgi:hypothetical protein